MVVSKRIWAHVRFGPWYQMTHDWSELTWRSWILAQAKKKVNKITLHRSLRRGKTMFLMCGCHVEQRDRFTRIDKEIFAIATEMVVWFYRKTGKHHVMKLGQEAPLVNSQLHLLFPPFSLLCCYSVWINMCVCVCVCYFCWYISEIFSAMLPVVGLYFLAFCR